MTLRTLLLVALALVTAEVGGARTTAALASAWRQALATADTPALQFPYTHCFRRSAAAHGLPITLLLAVARGESDFDPTARSHANAIGLMQIQWPGTARHLGVDRVAALYDPCTNVDAGSRYLKELIERYRGRVDLALAAYNYGPGRIAVGAATIPDGAAWYGGYILRHHAYVTGTNQPAAARTVSYAAEGKLELIRFARPYRAEAFVATLTGRLPGLRLEWFRRPGRGYRVVALYRGDEELERARERLRRAGIEPLAR